jgi:hypothetical protein
MKSNVKSSSSPLTPCSLVQQPLYSLTWKYNFLFCNTAGVLSCDFIFPFMLSFLIPSFLNVTVLHYSVFQKQHTVKPASSSEPVSIKHILSQCYISILSAWKKISIRDLNTLCRTAEHKQFEGTDHKLCAIQLMQYRSPIDRLLNKM